MQEAGLPNFWIVGLQMTVMLCLVLGVLFGLVHLAKRMQGKLKGQDAAAIDIVSARQLGPKKQVVLLEVMGQRILVGVGPDRITRLARFKAPDDDFSRRLEESLQEQEAAPPRNKEKASS